MSDNRHDSLACSICYDLGRAGFLLPDCDSCPYNLPVSPDDTQRSCELGYGEMVEGGCTRAPLPRVADLVGIDPAFTGGLSSDEYVRRMRDEEY